MLIEHQPRPTMDKNLVPFASMGVRSHASDTKNSLYLLFYYTMSQPLKDFVAPFKRQDNDDWSPEVQVAQLTFEITELQGHVKTHDKDVDAKRSLLKKVARRRKFLKYLKDNALERYNLIVKKLGIKA